jgi:hypothetical protein
MVAQFTSIKFHDSLHGGLAKRGTGTATIKAKLHQSLAWHDQCPLYQIYLDLKKAYDTLDREQRLNILAAYGVGPKMLALQSFVFTCICSSLASLFDLLERRHFLSASGLFANILQFSQK